MQHAIEVFGVPMDLGAARPGAALAPAALRRVGMRNALCRTGWAVRDHGDLAVPPRDEVAVGNPCCRYADGIAAVCRRLAAEVAAAIARGALPLTLGGDHSVSIGSIGGLAQRRRPGVLWFDAHGDFNTSATTPSGNVHGMPLAVLCGLGDPRLIAAAGAALVPAAIALVGTRSLDPGERRLLEDHGVNVFPMAVIDQRGIAAVTAEAIERVLRHADCLHVSLDPDVLDPGEAPGSGTPVANGLGIADLDAAMRLVARSGLLRSMDVLEVNPLFDPTDTAARVAAGLAVAALGTPYGEAAGFPEEGMGVKSAVGPT